MKAISLGEEEIVEMLCQRLGIKLNLKDKLGKSILIYASEKNQFRIVRSIVEGAVKFEQDLDINAFDKRGRTALIYSVMNKNEEILDLLLSYKQKDGQKH
jgi:ankyrin repeat protein